MTTPKRPAKRAATAAATAPTGDVEAFLGALDHPRLAEIRALREIILGADPSITESIKWNAPSFRTSEHFATFHLRSPDGVRVILHFGAKPGRGAGARAAISDPGSLLHWLADDRASVSFGDLGEVDARRSDFTALLRQWIVQLSG